MRGVLDYDPKKKLRTVIYPVKMNYEKQCLFIKEPVKTKGADMEDTRKEDADKEGRRQDMEKPAKIKSVTWVPQESTKAMSTMIPGAAKALPRMTPAKNSWRIWDPGRSEVHVVLRGVIVSIKTTPERRRALCRIQVVYMYM
jgi:hypothetical protein